MSIIAAREMIKEKANKTQNIVTYKVTDINGDTRDQNKSRKQSHHRI